MGGRYELRLYDTALAQFDFAENRYGEKSVRGLEFNESRRALLPLDIIASPTEGEVLRFAESRRIPRKRAYADRILEAFGLEAADVQSVIDVTRSVSFNDSYSIVPVVTSERYADYSLYEGGYDEAMQELAITGRAALADPPSSPAELTVGGSFPKALSRKEDGLYLYKAGDPFPASNTGLEPYAEQLASEAADAAGIPHARYEVTEWKGALCSVCKVFNDDETSFVPFHLCLSREEADAMTLEGAIAWFSGAGDDAREGFLDMLAFDATVCNLDRHMGNYGVMRDNASGEIIGFAPLFDHNYSFWTLDDPLHDGVERLVAKAAKSRGAFSPSLRNQAALTAGQRQRGIVERLASYRMEYPEEFGEYARAHLGARDVYGKARFEGVREAYERNAEELAAAMDAAAAGRSAPVEGLGTCDPPTVTKNPFATERESCWRNKRDSGWKRRS